MRSTMEDRDPQELNGYAWYISVDDLFGTSNLLNLQYFRFLSVGWRIHSIQHTDCGHVHQV